MQKKIVKPNNTSQSKFTTKPIEETILDIIQDISKRQYSLDFREPVDVKALGLNDYYDIIVKPMDLTTLRILKQNNFLEGEYKTIQDVWDAFNLIVTNCKAYNKIPEHPINARADQLKARVDNLFQKFIEDLKATGVKTDEYQLRVDESDLKAKEDKKRKIKMLGLDEKNILNNCDKRQQMAPGSLNEKKLFDMQNPENQIQMGLAQKQTSYMSQSQSEQLFAPNGIKSSSQNLIGQPQKEWVEDSYTSIQGDRNKKQSDSKNGSTKVSLNLSSVSVEQKRADLKKEYTQKLQKLEQLRQQRKKYDELRVVAKHQKISIKKSFYYFLKEVGEDQLDLNKTPIKKKFVEELQSDKKNFPEMNPPPPKINTQLFKNKPEKEKSAEKFSQGTENSGRKHQDESEEEEFRPTKLQTKIGILKTPQVNHSSQEKRDKMISSPQQKQNPHENNQINLIKSEHSKLSQNGSHLKNNSALKNNDLLDTPGQGSQQKKREDEEDRTHSQPVPSPDLSKIKLLPAAPKLQKFQSQKAAQIIQLRQKQQQEEQNRLEKSKMEERIRKDKILKRKEQKMLQDHQQRQQLLAAAAAQAPNSEKEENPSILNNSSNLLKISVGDKSIKPNALNKQSDQSQSDFSKIKATNNEITESFSLQQYAQPINPAYQGGERADLKFFIDKKVLKQKVDQMQMRKQRKYKKLLQYNLQKMQQITNQMIYKWKQQKPGVQSETLIYFRDILEEYKKIKENLDVRKIQLFLKMFLYRLRDFYMDLESEEQIEDLKSSCEKLHKIASRTIVYKTPLPYRDDPLFANIDPQIINNEILNEDHPLKKLQEETLEIEREMKQFRRMLSRDNQKYQEVSLQVDTPFILNICQIQSSEAMIQGNMMMKKHKLKDDAFSYSGMGDGDGWYGGQSARQGYEDQRDIGGIGEKDTSSQKQSEFLQFFSEYNKMYEDNLNDLSRVRAFLAQEEQNYIISQIKDTNKSRGIDLCQTIVSENCQNEMDITDYFIKKRKLNTDSKRNKNSDKKASNAIDFYFNNQIKEEEEILENREKLKADENVDALDENQFIEFSLSLCSMNTDNQDKPLNQCIFDQDSSEEELIKQEVSVIPLNKLANDKKSFDDGPILINQDRCKLLSKSINNQLIDVNIPFNPFLPKQVVFSVDKVEFSILQIDLANKLDEENQLSVLQKTVRFIVQEDPTLKELSIYGALNFKWKCEIRLLKNPSLEQLNEAHLKECPLNISIRNSLSKIAYWRIREGETIQNQILFSCFQNTKSLSNLCPEDIEQALIDIPNHIKDNRYQQNVLKIFNSDSASLIKCQIGEKGEDENHKIFTLNSLFCIPFNKLSEIEIQINNQRLFPLQQPILQPFRNIK